MHVYCDDAWLWRGRRGCGRHTWTLSATVHAIEMTARLPLPPPTGRGRASEGCMFHSQPIETRFPLHGAKVSGGIRKFVSPPENGISSPAVLHGAPPSVDEGMDGPGKDVKRDALSRAVGHGTRLRAVTVVFCAPRRASRCRRCAPHLAPLAQPCSRRPSGRPRLRPSPRCS